MHFQNPTIFYFLWLLIIPIIVHLFQLQKFVKVPFTNVAFLQKIFQENRKSSKIKKWLILATRLLLFLSLLFAFSQPYFSNKNTTKNLTNFIYLDNSLSTIAEGEKGILLKNAIQEIIENTSAEETFSLLTNTEFFENLSYEELKNKLLLVKNSSISPDFESILLKISKIQNNKSKDLHKSILISDFQNTYENMFTNVTTNLSAIKLNNNKENNISLDSIYISKNTNDIITVNAIVKNQGEKKEGIPIALYDKKKLINKQSFSIENNSTTTLSFSLQNSTELEGEIKITYSDIFPFDNSKFFTLNRAKKINVLSIGKPNKFLSKIYVKNEFNFTFSSLQNLDYNAISKQELIILNEIENIPATLANTLVDFSNKGGSVVIIPNTTINISSYNSFFRKVSSFIIQTKKTDSLKITSINFDHPVFKNVFSKKVNNFQYPSTKEFFNSNNRDISSIISFENNTTFIGQVNSTGKKIYWFANSLTDNISNFSKSPLIVPVFYNFAKLSFKNTQLYYEIGKINQIDVNVKLNKDEIVSIKNRNSSFIPQQQTYQNKVVLSLNNLDLEPDYFYVTKDKDTIQTLALNPPKSESLLKFLDEKTTSFTNKNIVFYTSVEDYFKEQNKKNEVHWLWKWFLALAIVSLLLEILILKFYKP
ncbi:BatA domain-containing protein [Polaribacter sp.]|uniref:BatA domain-containing protein n=1 Tax=Polaribacter sp. TaxID=1920175 RepID=UPI003F6A1412